MNRNGQGRCGQNASFRTIIVGHSPILTTVSGGRCCAFLPYAFWEHTIRDDRDLAAHLDYIHFNPVKHGLAEHPAEWPHSSFRRCVAGGLYPTGWMRSAGDGCSAINRNGQSRRRRNVSFRTIIVGHSPILTTVSGGRRCAFPPYACCLDAGISSPL
jgi:hypothetical protein